MKITTATLDPQADLVRQPSLTDRVFQVEVASLRASPHRDTRSDPHPLRRLLIPKPLANCWPGDLPQDETKVVNEHCGRHVHACGVG